MFPVGWTLSPKTAPEIAVCDGRFVLAIPSMLGTLAVNAAVFAGSVKFAAAVVVNAAMLVVLATLAVVIFAFQSMSSVALVSAAETPVNAGRFTPPEN